MDTKISGVVVHGKGYGRKIGFPTVNLGEIRAEALPPYGVYSGSAVLEGKVYRAGIILDPNGKIEAHLIGYGGDAYGREVVLEVGKFIREFKHFETEDELIIQIKKDLELC